MRVVKERRRYVLEFIFYDLLVLVGLVSFFELTKLPAGWRNPSCPRMWMHSILLRQNTE